MQTGIKIINVIPIGKGSFKEELSYYAENVPPPGSVIHVPIRAKETPALVIGVSDIRDAKKSLKEAPYALQKITQVTSSQLFTSGFIEAARTTAHYFGGTLGQVLNEFSPRVILENLTSLPAPTKDVKVARSNAYVIQGSEEDRLALEKRLIRESFAQNKSIFISSPTVAFAEHLGKFFSRGIEDYVFILHSDLSKKEILSRWHKALATDHPVVIVGTKSFLSIPRSDLGTLVIEKEGSPYRQFTRPYLDARFFAEQYARFENIRFILADSLLRVETYHLREKGIYDELLPTRHRVPREIHEVLIDMREYDGPNPRGEKIEVLSPTLRTTIERSIPKKEPVLVLASRRGVAPETICGDCREVVMCDQCSSPLVLHGSGSSAVFLCHKCGSSYSSERRCVRCGSWKLYPFGIGIEKVYNEIERTFPQARLSRFDSDTLKTPKAIRDTLKAFEVEGGILVATEMILPYLTFTVPHVAIATIDNLFTLPDFRINEKIVRLLFAFKESAEKSFLIQTRKPGEKLFDYILRGSMLPFYRGELGDRERLGYPPFTTIIRITRSGKEKEVREEMERLGEILLAWDPIQTPAFVSREKNEYRLHIFLKLPRGTWPEEKLHAILESLPSTYTVQVDPEGML